MGPWATQRQVYLVRLADKKTDINAIDIGSTSSNPYALNFGCMLQTGGSEPSPQLTYIEQTFRNIIPGVPYYVSFWMTIRSTPSPGNFPAPSKFSVYLNSKIVFSEPPTSYLWQQMNTSIIISNVAFLTLRFEATQQDSQDRSMGIVGIILHRELGTRSLELTANSSIDFFM
jgi:hypothetical protein